jgi:integrase
MSRCNTQVTSELVAADCASWPAADQAAWRSLFDPANGRRRCRWVRQTQYQNAGVYTRYLACMARSGLRADLYSDGVKAFIAECQKAECTVITIAGYIWALWKVAGLIRPGSLASLEWLLTTCRNLETVARASQKTGAHRKVDSAELALAGERLIAEARLMVGMQTDDLPELVRAALRAGPTVSMPRATWRAIQLFRDGLFLMVGAYAPERRRALATISIDQINLRDGVIDFEPAQIKTKRPSIRPLPAHVVDHIVEWMMLWRPLRNPSHRMLWIASSGAAPCGETLYAAMTKATRRKEVLGFPVSPHDFRDAAATLVVENAPERSRLATIVLDHRSEEMTRNYTEQANQIIASRQLAATLARTRKTVERHVRAMTSSTIALNPRSRRLRESRHKT